MQRILNIQSRISPVALARVVVWLKDKGYQPKSKSDALATAVEVLSKSIDGGENFTEQKALEYLASVGLRPNITVGAVNLNIENEFHLPSIEAEALDILNLTKTEGEDNG